MAKFQLEYALPLHYKKKSSMIPEDFKDFFLSSSASAQSEIVSMLLSTSTDDINLVDNNEVKAISCPHC